MMANKSNSSFNWSNNDDDDDHQADSASEDKGRYSGTSRRSVAASLRDFAESMLMRHEAELEMIKAREALRIEAENQRLERENELTELMLKTQLQLTSFICSQACDRKRKRTEEDGSDSDVSDARKGAMLLSLLHFNFGI
ncbi:uncharacterized protein At4g22160-like [Bidens hawaiensis]|uniref:uncharacterized protein At4g22160-like n=1 Tax=Bidens hawaiensis TaxID=980011 RepID=UPI0040497F75